MLIVVVHVLAPMGAQSVIFIEHRLSIGCKCLRKMAEIKYVMDAQYIFSDMIEELRLWMVIRIMNLYA
jgi:hypothetical protein